MIIVGPFELELFYTNLLRQHANMTNRKPSELWQGAVNKPVRQVLLPLSGDHSFHLQHHQPGWSKAQHGSFFWPLLPVCCGKKVSASENKLFL